MKLNLFVIVLFTLMLTGLFAFGCDDENDENLSVPSNEDACANYDNVCAGNENAGNCAVVVGTSSLEDCKRKCIGYGGDCDDINECIEGEGDLYDKYCVIETTPSDSTDYPSYISSNSCIGAKCSYEFQGCSMTPDCVKTFYCWKACEEEGGNDCMRSCMDEYSVGRDIDDLRVCSRREKCELFDFIGE